MERKMRSVPFLIRVISVLTFLLNPIVCRGQELNGRIMDARGNGIAFANIMALSADSAFLSGTVSREDGTFSFSRADQHVAMLRISSLGYRSRVVPHVGDDFGNIVMQEDTTILREVVVQGNRPMHRMTADGLVTNVAGTVLGRLGTADDVLQYVPSLRKTDKGYEVFGKGQPLIYLNGKKVTSPTELDQLSADNIKSVTLIDNPGAEYDASVNAVIKIRTLPKAGDGFGGSYRQVLAAAHYFMHIEQLDWNYRTKGLDLFGTFYFSRLGNMQRQTGYRNIDGGNTQAQTQALDIYSRTRYARGTVGFNYDIDGNHSFGATYVMDAHLHSGGWWESAMDVSMGNGQAEHLMYNFDMRVKRLPNHDVKAYYSGTLGKVSLDWNGEIYMSKDGRAQQSEETGGMSQDNGTVTSDYGSRSRLYATKLTSSLPIGKGKLTIGSEFTDILRNSLYTVTGTGSLLPDDTRDRTTEWNLAGFTSYGIAIGQVKLNAGLRYEHVSFKYYSDGIYMAGQSRTYDNLFPNLSVNFPIGKFTMSLAYTAKTSRPSYSMLSSNVQYDDRFTYQGGNPTLQPMQTHTVGLDVSYKWVHFSANWKYYHDAFFQEIRPYEKSADITVYSFRNLAHYQSVYAGLTLSPSFGWWKPMFDVGVRKQFFHVYDENMQMKFDRPVCYVTFNNIFNLPWGLMGTLNMNYTSRGHSTAILWDETGDVKVGITKSLLKEHLSLNLQVEDLFYTGRNVSWMSYGNYETYKWNKMDSRQLVLTVRYKFNVAKSKYKGTGAGTEDKGRL